MTHPPAARPARLEQLQAWAADPQARGAFSPLAEHPYLLFDAGGAQPPEPAQSRIRAWLRELPCPSLAIAAEPTALTPACDVVLDNAEDAGLLIDNIARSPLAASVLAQLLRAVESMPLADALLAESLAYSTLQAGPEFQRWRETQRAVPAAAPPARDVGPPVLVERDDATLRLQLNRPSNRNAMSVEMRDALVEALQLVLCDDSIRSVHIAARGKCFSVGGDLAEFGTAPDPAVAHAIRSLTLPGRLLAACADRVEIHVHGACIGSGIEFPAFAARLGATADAHFQLPELKYGLIPGAGGCASITRRIGRQRTAWLALSGRRIKARQALEWGLVDVVDDHV
ncbi:MAG: enoyl-CoA hydratase/isomerase family protein [Nevskia sp.]|nr:enoyl-CoA hydratase/isomerase family protein [Nevskia sp.]